MRTTLGIAVWDEHVSTTLDFARELLLLELCERRETSRRREPLIQQSMIGKVRRIRELGVETLLCGAVSRPLAEALWEAGVQLVPHVSGPVEAILQAALRGDLQERQFLQPGCGPGARRRWRCRGCGRADPPSLEREPPGECPYGYGRGDPANEEGGKRNAAG